MGSLVAEEASCLAWNNRPLHQYYYLYACLHGVGLLYVTSRLWLRLVRSLAVCVPSLSCNRLSNALEPWTSVQIITEIYVAAMQQMLSEMAHHYG